MPFIGNDVLAVIFMGLALFGNQWVAATYIGTVGDVVPQQLAGRVNGMAGFGDNGAALLAVLYTGVIVDLYGWTPVFSARARCRSWRCSACSWCCAGSSRRGSGGRDRRVCARRSVLRSALRSAELQLRGWPRSAAGARGAEAPRCCGRHATDEEAAGMEAAKVPIEAHLRSFSEAEARRRVKCVLRHASAGNARYVTRV